MTTSLPHYGLIGAGHQGVFLAAGRKIVAVADVSEDTLKTAATTLQLASDHCYSDWKTMLEGEEDLDALIVATPATERKFLIELLEMRPLHIFCENPLACVVDEGGPLAVVAEKSGMVFTLNAQWLFLPAVKKLQALIHDGAIGEPLRVVVGGKGRDAVTEVQRIGSHLFSVAIHSVTGPPTAGVCTHFSTKAGTAIQATFTTTSGLPLIAEFWSTSRLYDVRRCFIEVVGTAGRLKAMGGFLEGLWRHSQPYDTSDYLSTPRAGWHRVQLPGIWDIQAGMEDKALRDPAMNPTFWLLDMFEVAVTAGGINPYPPRRALPVVEAVDMMMTPSDACEAKLWPRLPYE